MFSDCNVVCFLEDRDSKSSALGRKSFSFVLQEWKRRAASPLTHAAVPKIEDRGPCTSTFGYSQNYYVHQTVCFRAKS
eukprot:606550-Amphidinium_carterae.1